MNKILRKQIILLKGLYKDDYVICNSETYPAIYMQPMMLLKIHDCHQAIHVSIHLITSSRKSLCKKTNEALTTWTFLSEDGNTRKSFTERMKGSDKAAAQSSSVELPFCQSASRRTYFQGGR